MNFGKNSIQAKCLYTFVPCHALTTAGSSENVFFTRESRIILVSSTENVQTLDSPESNIDCPFFKANGSNRRTMSTLTVPLNAWDMIDLALEVHKPVFSVQNCS